MFFGFSIAFADVSTAPLLVSMNPEPVTSTFHPRIRMRAVRCLAKGLFTISSTYNKASGWIKEANLGTEKILVQTSGQMLALLKVISITAYAKKELKAEFLILAKSKTSNFSILKGSPELDTV